MEREIVHIAVPAFPIALARLADSHLRQRPVAVAPGNSDRALLHHVSAEALAEGVTAGMALFRARRICPSLVVIPPDPLAAAKGNRALVAAASDFTPIIEPSAGRMFLDVTASRRLFGPARDVAARLEKTISVSLGLQAMAGAGTNKLICRVAADALPEPGVYDVFHGTEQTFLAPFPVHVLPGVGGSREGQLLRDLNLRRVEDVANLSIPQLRLAVGPFAPLLHERSRGIDRSPVQPPRRSPEIVEEAFLEQEENDDAILLAEVCRLAEACGLRLRRLGKGARKISLTISYADGVSEAGTKSFPSPRSLDVALFAATEEVYLATCRRRVRVKGLRLACGGIGDATGQMELFAIQEETSPRQVALQETLDLLRERLGADSVRWGRMVITAVERPVAADVKPAKDFSEYRYHTLTTRAGR